MAVQAPCPAGVLAQTPEGAYAFTEGWVRLRLTPCPGAQRVGARLEVIGASAVLAFKPGPARGATVGVLAPADAAPLPPVQDFPLPSGSGSAHEVVLAPVEPGGVAPAFKRLRLLATP